MYEDATEGCHCMVDEQFSWCSHECQEGYNCGCAGCDCGSETDS